MKLKVHALTTHAPGRERSSCPFLLAATLPSVVAVVASVVAVELAAALTAVRCA